MVSCRSHGFRYPASPTGRFFHPVACPFSGLYLDLVEYDGYLCGQVQLVPTFGSRSEAQDDGSGSVPRPEGLLPQENKTDALDGDRRFIR